VVERIRQWLAARTPVQLLALCFIAAIAIGTFLLALPFSTTEPISFIDALFTATSAVCVTGLIVVETGARFTGFGQGVILFLIQLGGLGLMMTSTFVLLTLGNRASLRNLIMLRGEYTVSGVGSAKRLLITVGAFTLAAEAAGAFIFARRFAEVDGLGRNAAWCGIFHSISAFCNAGFSLFGNSFEDYRGDLTINLAMPFLIIFGGIGFPALIDLFRKLWARVHGVRVALSLHAKIVFVATAVLLIAGMAGFLAIEGPRMDGDPSFGERVGVAWFQSVTTRTAGFNTLDFGTAAEPTLLLALVLMVIGGSPGSTAGGIKTTTFVVIILVVIARLRGHERVEVGKRTIPPAVITKALVVAVLGAALIMLATLMLLITDGMVPKEDGKTLSFVSLVFEVVSAFGTVGLSILDTAATGALTWAGKVIIICVMYLGRLGPLLLAQMVFAADRPLQYEYPEEYLLVG